MIIAGEILSFLAAIVLAYSTFSNRKKTIMWWQALNALIYGLSNFFLGGYSATISCSLIFARNILSARNKLTKRGTIFLCILIIIVGLYFNNKSWLGLIPIIASIQSTICIYALKTAQQMRITLIINLLQWVVFDFSVQAYPMFIMDIIIIVVTSINLIRYKNNHKTKLATSRHQSLYSKKS